MATSRYNKRIRNADERALQASKEAHLPDLPIDWRLQQKLAKKTSYMKKKREYYTVLWSLTTCKYYLNFKGVIVLLYAQKV